MRVLLLEDAEDVAEAIRASFARQGDAVDHVRSVSEAVDCIAVQGFDVGIFDLSLPDGNGRAAVRAARDADNPMPILILTAQSGIEDRVAALDEGADDYLVKPFDLRELHARVRALARRTGSDRGGAVTYADLVFDPAGRILTIDGVPAGLTRRETTLFEVLLANRERIVSKERIYERMFSFDEEDVALNAVEIHMTRLRKKLDASRVKIKTLRGLGYQMTEHG
ncbi:two-component system, OmpR family, response regulator TctD [Roseivivax marinus]|uniref:response regulator transcription factor n=1 Tax=Roseivivax marinus TaxID=1379903 RepID=UPI0008AEF2D0|nr:response regulator transcription factor [Roseivivax marinus]SEK71673.1 two-component system, OmpR family, response regulator TctD [Roseivivax marinus]